MKNLLLIIGLISIGILLTFSNCQKEIVDDNPITPQDSTNNTKKELKFLDIANAKSLLILNSGGKKNNSGNLLFKITDEGYVIEVPYIDQFGDTMTNTFSPMALFSLSDSFMTIGFEDFGKFLLRKSDGAIFKGSDKLPTSLANPDRPDIFRGQDSIGNIYYVYNEEIIKLDVTDPNNLTISTISAPGDQVKSGFVVDKYGNLAYNQRYRHYTGGFENFNQVSPEWTDLNNDFIYGRDMKVGTTCWGKICRIIGTSPLSFENYGDSTFSVNCASHIVKIKSKNKVIGEGCGFVYELFNQTGEPSKIPISYFNITVTKNLTSSDNYYYLIGTDEYLQSKLIKVDPNGHTFTNILTTGAFDIYNIIVNDSDEIQFYALRMNDGKRILAEIDNEGTIKVLSVLDGSTVTALERIN